jgi:16S rRNA (guanine(966)-N(2))-methyltransferase RsmD
MRVIAGTSRGVPLFTPPGNEIRPTLDRVRESLFNVLMHRTEGCRFLDLFAGTGANGIEALSRGAASAVFVDQDAKSIELVQRNLQKTRLEANAVCQRLQLPAGLTTIGREGCPPFDIVFCDPPYAFSDYVALLTEVQTQQLLAEGAVVIVETFAAKELPQQIGVLTLERRRVYGDTALSFFS